jgi:hypothetical protein
MSFIKLVSYRPLCLTSTGRKAMDKFKFPPFIDGSCRLEPDFENGYPSISALCRKGKFAPTLQEGDFAIYLTVKSRYEQKKNHWKLTAILKIMKRFENHQMAADWYLDHKLAIPSNCMVISNECKELDQTAGLPRGVNNLSEWDTIYQERAEENPVFLACEKQFMNLKNPPILTDDDMSRIFGTKRPGTQNPRTISLIQYNELMDIAKKG